MSLNQEELFYRLGLQMVPNIGDAFARRLITHFGSAKAIFEASSKSIQVLFGIGEKRFAGLRLPLDQTRIEKEMRFIEQNNIEVLAFDQDNYPKNLSEVADAPLLLFYKGSASLQSRRQLAIIGSRKCTEYGKLITESLVEGLSRHDVQIVSGLAFGIDLAAHKAALHFGAETIGVMGTSLDRIYPEQNAATARKMLEQGGLLSEYPSGTKPDKQNFPMRNRIVAALCDATLVVETDVKGGAMITAKLATSYNREVLAVPGRVTDSRSSGCNYLIKTNIAQLVTSAEDVLNAMNWLDDQPSKAVQTRLFEGLSSSETLLVDLLRDKDAMHIDEIQLKSDLNNSELAALLLNLEFQQFVTALPGKRFRLNQ